MRAWEILRSIFKIGHPKTDIRIESKSEAVSTPDPDAVDMDSIDYLAEIRAFHQEFVEPYTGKPAGCSKGEIRELESTMGFELPLAYKQYLRWMGKDYRGFLVGSDCFLSHVEDNLWYLRELLDENNLSSALPEHYLCFFMHQGYIAAWFLLPKADDDPPLWIYHETEMTEPLLEGTFTDFLFGEMKGMASLYGRR